MARVPHPRGDGGGENDDDVFAPEELPEDKLAGLAQSGAGTLRPERFEGYIGQRELVAKFKVFIEAAKQRNDLVHVFFFGDSTHCWLPRQQAEDFWATFESPRFKARMKQKRNQRGSADRRAS